MQDTKKVAGELLVELEKKGVTFETVDGKLKYKDSKGNFTENSKEKVKKYKEEIIEILKKKQTIDEFITDNDYETNVYPLTDVQAAYLVGKTEAVKWGGIGCKGYIEVDFGSYSAEELSRAWKVLVNRHEMLRAKVTEVGFEILERDEIDYEIKIVNLQKMAEREKVDTLSKIREDFSEYVFHTEEPPLFKVLITKRIEGNFFHLLVDLIVSDFASVQLLISEMGELLKGASLEKIRYKFSDYAMFNQQRKGSLKWHQDRMYWLERLKKLPEAPILPQDGRAADKCENTYEFYRFQKHINQSDWKRIKEIAGEYGVTVSSVLIGIYAEVISRWSSNKHFTLNLPIQNRPTIGNNTNSIVGDFTAVNLLEVNVTQNMSFIERVKEITKRLMEDLEHNSFSGVEVLRELSKVSEEKELLMPIVFTGVLKTDGTVGTIEYGFSHTPQVWIDCQIVDEIDSEDQEKGLMISWDTRKGAIKESIVTEMFESFTETIRILGIKHSEEWKNPLEIIVPSASKKKVICEAFNDDLIEMIIGGVYNFSKAAAIDYVEEIKSYKAGIPMACVRNGKILPAQKRSPLNLPTRISKLSILPYVTEEIQEIIQGKYMLNIDSYTAAPVSLFSIVNKAHCQKKDLVNALMGQKNSNQKAFIWVRQNKGNDSRCIYFEGKNPSVLTGEILAITANAIFEMPRKDGIYTMASYLEKYQVLDELKKIDKFKSEGKI